MVNRLKSLDILRATFLIFAIWQHYGYMGAFWYVEFSENVSLNPYPVHFGGAILSYIFTPWVSHTYIFLACLNLNLSRHTSIQSRRLKWLAYGMLMVGESFLIWPSLQDALTIPPILIGIAVMFIVSYLVQIGSWRLPAFALLLVLCLYEPILIPAGDQFNLFIKGLGPYPDWEYNARLEYFLGTGLLGYLVGYLICKRSIETMSWLMLISMSTLIPWVLWGNRYVMPSYDPFTNEYLLSRTVVDILGVWSVVTFVVSTAVYIELKGFTYPWTRPLVWISLNTWTIFALHQIVYKYIFGPIIEFCADNGWTSPHTSMPDIIALTTCLFLIIYVAMYMLSKIYGVYLSCRMRT